nr:MAG TPA: hypothetical protein [Inoviridae sp.]
MYKNISIKLADKSTFIRLNKQMNSSSYDTLML